jgi:hypothetical protein
MRSWSVGTTSSPSETSLLVELLAGRETGEHHLDVLVGLEAREADHLAREVGDAHGLAHLEDEDLATATRPAACRISCTASGMAMK